MTHNIEVFYTGGGITLAEVAIDATHYAVVSSDAPDFLAIYKTADDGEKYLPDDMLVSSSKEEIATEYQPLYTEMLQKLKIA